MRAEQTFEVTGAQPFSAAALLGFLGRRTIAGVEAYAVTDGQVRYARTVRLAHGPGLIELTWTGRVLLATTRTARPDQDQAVALIERLCDAHAPAASIDAQLERSEALRRLVRSRPGLRVPGTVDTEELAFRALIGQQISLAAAATCAAKLASRFGEPVNLPGRELTRLFPSATALAAVDPAELPMPAARGRALVGLARILSDGTLDLVSDRPWASRRAELLATRGIGPWTADYIAMRALGNRDVLLATDLVIKRELARRGITTTADWAPFRSYATMHLWFGSPVLDTGPS